MLKRYLAIAGFLALSSGAQAAMIERDWLAEGDKCLTYVSELNVEILDVSFTSNIGHVAATKELAAGGLYEGFRFMNKAEIWTIIDGYFGGMPQQTRWLDSGSQDSLQMSSFLNLINATSTFTFNTCEHALGCEVGGPRDMGNYLKDSQRWLFTPDVMHMIDQVENATQLLIRDVVTVPEPAGVLLFGFGLMMVAGLRYRQLT